MRRRLFRRRTNWGVLKGNLHVFVTAAALLATAFAWNGSSIADRAPPAEVASAVSREIIEPAELDATLDPEMEPPSDAPATSPALALLMPANARIVEPDPTAAPLPTPRPPAPLRDGVGAPPALTAGTPAAATPTAIAPAPRSAEHAPRAPRARAIIRQQPRHLRYARPTESPRRSKNPQRNTKQASSESDRDPFSCAVRKQSPCF